MLPTTTEVWIECDGCGGAFGGPGLAMGITRIGDAMLCTECQRKLTAALGHRGVTATRKAAASRTTGELKLGGA